MENRLLYKITYGIALSNTADFELIFNMVRSVFVGVGSELGVIYYRPEEIEYLV